MAAADAGSRWRRSRGPGAWPDGPRRRRARRTRWRRWAAAGLAALAVLVTLGALRPVPAGGAGVPTVVMLRDVAAGQRIGPDDVAVATRPGGQRPESALTRSDAAVGRIVAAPLAVHDVVTPERLLGPDLLAGQPADRVAISVPVLDAASVGARPGDHIDLYATGTGTRTASDVVVLAVHDAEESTGLGIGAPARVTLSLDPSQAAEVARGLSALAAGQSLVIAIRH
ncbi:SAF domain-containing protein [Terrabacter carboxydivorans]|uniref:SAF domain-containing protein n=1 Tax=Terrabacter carboxydivorans TaxID=619730 RepID=A0ABN3L0U5_9MICO